MKYYQRLHIIVLSVLMLCVSSSGCRLTENLVRTMVIEPFAYARNLETKRERTHFLELANCALDRARSLAQAELDRYDCEPFSVDEECGFVDGFVDFLEAGGTGHPPPLPPRRYWKARYENLVGYQAVQDWFTGYALGAGAAQETGYRDLITISASDLLVNSTVPYYAGQGLVLETADDLEDELDDAMDGEVYEEIRAVVFDDTPTRDSLSATAQDSLPIKWAPASPSSSQFEQPSVPDLELSPVARQHAVVTLSLSAEPVMSRLPSISESDEQAPIADPLGLSPLPPAFVPKRPAEPPRESSAELSPESSPD